MLLLILVAAIALQIRQWRHLYRRLTSGSLTKPRAIGLYFMWALAPAFLLGAALLTAVGLEEQLDVAIVSEGIARTVLPVGILLLGAGVVGSIAFGVSCARSGQQSE